MDVFLSPLKYDASLDFCHCFFVHNGANVGRQAPMIAIAFSAKTQNRGPAVYPGNKDGQCLFRTYNSYFSFVDLHKVSLK